MKSLKVLAIGLAVAGAVVFLSGLAFAGEGCAQGKMAHHEARIKLLQDAAAALQKSNPDLAKGLSEYADQETKKMKLLQDAAAALQQSNPDLAKGLQGMCEGRRHKATHKKTEHTSKQDETKQ